MTRISLRNSSKIALALSVAALGACTVLPPQALRAPGQDSPLAFPDPGSKASPVTKPSLVSNQAGALTGVVSRPDVSLISNNSGALIANQAGSLIDVGTGVFLTDPGTGVFWRAPFRLAAAGPSIRTADSLGQTPLAGARVEVFVTREADGQAIKVAETFTDVAGRYSVSLPASSSGAVLVEVPFQAASTDVTFSALASLPATGAVEVPVDAVTTLVVEGLAGGNRATLGGQALANAAILPFVRNVATALRSALTPDDFPYMGRSGRDLRNFLAQRLEDTPVLGGGAGAVIEFIRRQADGFEVETVFRKADLFPEALSSPAVFPIADLAGHFEISPDGDLLMPRWKRGGVNSQIELVRVQRVGGAIATSSVGVTPPGFRSPALMGLAPDGTPYLAAVKVDNDLTNRQLTCFRLPEGATTFEQVGSSSIEIPAGEVILRAGRLAIDRDRNVAVAIPGMQVVYHLPAGSGTSWRVLAGMPDATGSIDGTGSAARFHQPGSAVFGPDGHLLVADRSSRAIRRVVLATGEVTTVSGVSSEAEGERNGRAGRALYRRPYALVVQDFEVFVSDPLVRKIRKLSRDGGTFRVAGTGAAGLQDGAGHEATFTQPGEIRAGVNGDLWVLDGDLVSDPDMDFSFRRIRRLSTL